jgi:hypothetical protein
MEIRNAKIAGTTLGFEDHGIFTCFLHLEYGSGNIGQSFGGYFLESHPKMIQSILKTVGVNSWENLKGKYIRAEFDNIHVERIGHITEDKWYNPKHE